MGVIIICNHYKKCDQKTCQFKYGVDTDCLNWHSDIAKLDWDPKYTRHDDFDRLDLVFSYKVKCPNKTGHWLDVEKEQLN